MKAQPFRVGPGLIIGSLLLSLAGCAADEATSIDCDTATVTPFSEMQAFQYCTSCHGASRADEGLRYDTYEDAVAHAREAQDSVADGSMPEDADMPDSAKEELYTWVQCGTPE